MSLAEILFIAGTVPYLLLGTVHIAWTLGDLRSPTHFRPVDETVIAAMQAERVAAFASAPGVRSLWQSWLGFNLSHGLGLLMFGIVPLAIALQDYELVDEITVIRPLTLVIPLVYLVLAWRFWFVAPAAATTVGFACFAASALT
jgi:hypothetical protein